MAEPRTKRTHALTPTPGGPPPLARPHNAGHATTTIPVTSNRIRHVSSDGDGDMDDTSRAPNTLSTGRLLAMSCDDVLTRAALADSLTDSRGLATASYPRTALSEPGVGRPLAQGERVDGTAANKPTGRLEAGTWASPAGTSPRLSARGLPPPDSPPSGTPRSAPVAPAASLSDLNPLAVAPFASASSPARRGGLGGVQPLLPTLLHVDSLPSAASRPDAELGVSPMRQEASYVLLSPTVRSPMNVSVPRGGSPGAPQRSAQRGTVALSVPLSNIAISPSLSRGTGAHQHNRVTPAVTLTGHLPLEAGYDEDDLHERQYEQLQRQLSGRVVTPRTSEQTSMLPALIVPRSGEKPQLPSAESQERLGAGMGDAERSTGSRPPLPLPPPAGTSSQTGGGGSCGARALGGSRIGYPSDASNNGDPIATYNHPSGCSHRSPSRTGQMQNLSFGYNSSFALEVEVVKPFYSSELLLMRNLGEPLTTTTSDIDRPPIFDGYRMASPHAAPWHTGASEANASPVTGSPRSFAGNLGIGGGARPPGAPAADAQPAERKATSSGTAAPPPDIAVTASSVLPPTTEAPHEATTTGGHAPTPPATFHSCNVSVSPSPEPNRTACPCPLMPRLPMHSDENAVSNPTAGTGESASTAGRVGGGGIASVGVSPAQTMLAPVTASIMAAVNRRRGSWLDQPDVLAGRSGSPNMSMHSAPALAALYANFARHASPHRISSAVDSPRGAAANAGGAYPDPAAASSTALPNGRSLIGAGNALGAAEIRMTSWHPSANGDGTTTFDATVVVDMDAEFHRYRRHREIASNAAHEEERRASTTAGDSVTTLPAMASERLSSGEFGRSPTTKSAGIGTGTGGRARASSGCTVTFVGDEAVGSDAAVPSSTQLPRPAAAAASDVQAVPPSDIVKVLQSESQPAGAPSADAAASDASGGEAFGVELLNELFELNGLNATDDDDSASSTSADGDELEARQTLEAHAEEQLRQQQQQAGEAGLQSSNSLDGSQLSPNANVMSSGSGAEGKDAGHDATTVLSGSLAQNGRRASSRGGHTHSHMHLHDPSAVKPLAGVPTLPHPDDAGDCGCTAEELTKHADKHDLDAIDAMALLKECCICHRQPATFLCFADLAAVCASHVHLYAETHPGHTLFINIADVTTSFDRIFWCERCEMFTWRHTDPCIPLVDRLIQTRRTYYSERPVTDVYMQHYQIRDQARQVQWTNVANPGLGASRGLNVSRTPVTLALHRRSNSGASAAAAPPADQSRRSSMGHTHPVVSGRRLRNGAMVVQTGQPMQRLCVTMSSMQGWRTTQEDAEVVFRVTLPSLRLPPGDAASAISPADEFVVLAVFDGHGGDAVAKIAAHNIERHFRKALRRRIILTALRRLRAAQGGGAVDASLIDDSVADQAAAAGADAGPQPSQGATGERPMADAEAPFKHVAVSDLPPLHGDAKHRHAFYRDVLTDCFLSLDGAIRQTPEQRECQAYAMVGATACVVIVTSDDVVCANAGDSRAVLLDMHHKEAVSLSSDHKLTLEAERARVESAGYTIQNGRIEGMLAVPRALGDFDFKQTGAVGADKQAVCAQPDVVLIPRARLRAPSLDQPVTPRLDTNSAVVQRPRDLTRSPQPASIAQPARAACTVYNTLTGAPAFQAPAVRPPEDWCIALACDGVWDVLQPEKVAATVHEHFRSEVEVAYATVQTELIVNRGGVTSPLVPVTPAVRPSAASLSMPPASAVALGDVAAGSAPPPPRPPTNSGDTTTTTSDGTTVSGSARNAVQMLKTSTMSDDSDSDSDTRSTTSSSSATTAGPEDGETLVPLVARHRNKDDNYIRRRRRRRTRKGGGPVFATLPAVWQTAALHSNVVSDVLGRCACAVMREALATDDSNVEEGLGMDNMSLILARLCTTA